MIYKALSIKQPWASLIASGKKTIETRFWQTSYRGELLIVSSKFPQIDSLPTGQALAIAELYDCRPTTQADEIAACCTCDGNEFSWFLRNIRKIHPCPIKGQLRLFDVSLPKGIQISCC